MKFWGSEHVFDYPWDTCTSAMWRKYPNEHSPHVQSVDVINRKVDAQTGILSSVRLISMQSAIPSWLNRLFGVTQDQAYNFERSEVDPRQGSQRMTLRTRNLTFSDLLVVEETCTYTPHPEDPTKTVYRYVLGARAHCELFLVGKAEFICVLLEALPRRLARICLMSNSDFQTITQARMHNNGELFDFCGQGRNRYAGQVHYRFKDGQERAGDGLPSYPQ
jgi:hypothetical protein